MKLSIIVPVFNEENTIAHVLIRLLKLSIPDVSVQIIAVDDGSTDTTFVKIKKVIAKGENRIQSLQHESNMGKGAAIKSGIRKAAGDYVLIQDADMEYDPAYLEKLIEPIVNRRAKVVYGTRLKRLPNFSRDEKTIRFFVHYLGNRFLSLVTSILYMQWITDMETGYKLIPLKVLKKIDIVSKGFEVEAEITAKLLKKGYHIYEVAIVTNPRGYDEGKKLQTFQDGAKALLALIKYRFMD